MDEVQAIIRISEDREARRELLWLRAMEKEDYVTARDLEEVDPDVVKRLRAAGADVLERRDETLAERKERFRRLWDECFERHARCLGSGVRKARARVG
jgi:hypothetical protein